MKKCFVTVLACCIFVLGLVGCGTSGLTSSHPNPADDSVSVSQSALETAESSTAPDPVSQTELQPAEKKEESMKISVTAGETTIVYELNGSQAAKELYAQLPLTLEVENFSTNEKVFYPPNKLSTENTPMADAGKGTLAYYSPWGDVVMFYGHFEANSSLYGLGRAVSGEDLIETLSGAIKIAQVD